MQLAALALVLCASAMHGCSYPKFRGLETAAAANNEQGLDAGSGGYVGTEACTTTEELGHAGMGCVNDCDSCREGRPCNTGTDCTSQSCDGDEGECQPASCIDGIKNGTETAVDCGGECPRCLDGRNCLMNMDCESRVCSGTCQAPTCSDGLKNGTETSIDCGGDCPRCVDGRRCLVNGDCASGVCDGSCLASSCFDNLRNGDESDLNCGGNCPECEPARSCKVHSDCTTLVCNGGACQEATCSDGQTNGLETGVDCGGPICAGCADGVNCKLDSDCLSEHCAETRCSPAPTVTVHGATTGYSTDLRPIEFPHPLTLGANQNRLILLLVAAKGTSESSASPSTVEYAGTPFRLAISRWSGTRAWAGIYYLTDTDLPSTPGNYPLWISGYEFGAIAHVMELGNVDQSKPIDEVDSGFGGDCSDSPPVDSISVDTADAWLLSTVVAYGTASADPLSQQTETVDFSADSITLIGGYKGPVPTGSHEIGWDMSSCNNSVHLLLALRPNTYWAPQ